MRLSSDEVDDAYHQYLDEVEDDAVAARQSGGRAAESPPLTHGAANRATESE